MFVKFVYSKFVYIRKFYKMFIFFTMMTSIDTRKSTVNYYIHMVHHAVIFTIIQLSYIILKFKMYVCCYDMWLYLL